MQLITTCQTTDIDPPLYTQKHSGNALYIHLPYP